MNEIPKGHAVVAMSVNEGEIEVMMIVVITISVMNLKHVRRSQA